MISATPCFDALSYLCEYLLELFRVVSVNLVLVLSVHFLFLYYFKGLFNTYLIYFIIIISDESKPTYQNNQVGYAL